ncbi:MAG: glucose-1-phosphate adenylyltransferase subunit GlgD [Candidatus Eremiobacteraeota bacterium]|nr:glucose-1-phosphate adenylyltransferase subunit GlgD [Candidatus Eremiobacteraeota bacterium]
MSSAFALIMAGGPSPGLSVLTNVRAAPAVPFGGKYRLIDFSLSNCVNSGIYNVAVLTQYRPHSLSQHLGTGAPWDLDLMKGGLRVLHPFKGGKFGDWQQGTADAVRRNLEFVGEQSEDHVVVLAGDHVYTMDYATMLQIHENSGADLTVACRRVSPHETHRFGMIVKGNDDRITGFEEKPKRSRQTLASMGVYIFRRQALLDVLRDESYIDFGRDVLPAMIKGGKNVRAFTFPGYWTDIGTVQAYWESNMGLLSEDPALDLYNADARVHTRSQESGPVSVGKDAQVEGNLLSNGCVVEGKVERSIISPGVRIAPGAVVTNSIILHGTVIEAGAVVDKCIIDKQSHIGAEAKVGHGDDNTPNQDLPRDLNTGLTLVGREAVIPAGMTLGRNVTVQAWTDEAAFKKMKKKGVASGSVVGTAPD